MSPDEPDNLEDLPAEELPLEEDGENIVHYDGDDPDDDPDDPATDPAMKAVEEAGGGVAEGFELAEHDLIENAEGERDDDPMRNPFDTEVEKRKSDAEYGEADHVIDADEE